MVPVMWFKRDLRIEDNPALEYIAKRNSPAVYLYIFEPELLRQPDIDERHIQFILESLKILDSQLQRYGTRLTVLHDEVISVLTHLQENFADIELVSHEETGNLWTYNRDKRVKRWCRETGVSWTEFRQNGVVRGPHNRDKWAAQWKKYMEQELSPAPQHLQAAQYPSKAFPTLKALQASALDKAIKLQPAGEKEAHRLLDNFLEKRALTYRADMAQPMPARRNCSRLSPHLAYGTISTRYVLDKLHKKGFEVQNLPEGTPNKQQMLRAYKAFEARLAWRDHFIQKFEDEIEIEKQHVNPAFDALDRVPNDALFKAFIEGQTGYPLIDACIRAVRQEGWLTFRMRAMLMSFASNHLWLPWRETGVWLARAFTDYEPGIHWSQVQMQSGVTGINTIRIYNPIKQAQDNDPEGMFIKRFVPELAKIPSGYLHDLRLLPPLVALEIGFELGRDYPEPIVEHEQAYRKARDKLFALKNAESTKQLSKKVYQKHGSRKQPLKHRLK